MDARRKCAAIVSAAGIGFVALVSTEVADRARDVIGLASELRVKQSTLLPLDKALEKKADLLARKEKLTSLLASSANEFEHDEGGVFEFLSKEAQASSVQLRAVTPGTSQEIGEITEVPFGLDVVAPYHRFAEFLNCLETGEFMVSIRKMTLGRDGAAAALRGTVSGVAYIPSRKAGK
jgi:Tfp pilus assembly protein PilO